MTSQNNYWLDFSFETWAHGNFVLEQPIYSFFILFYYFFLILFLNFT